MNPGTLQSLLLPHPQVDGHNLVPGELESNKRPSLPSSLFEQGHLISSSVGRREFTLLFCRKTGIYTGPQAFRLSYEHQLSWVSSLHVAGHGTSQPPEFHEPVPHDKSPFIHIISVLFLWRTLVNTQYKNVCVSFKYKHFMLYKYLS